jgi:hypothetical protein
MRLTRISLSFPGFGGIETADRLVHPWTRVRDFNIQQHWLNESYLIRLPRFEKGPFWHARVALYPTGLTEPRIERAADEVISYKRSFDFDAYFSLPEKERKMLSLVTLHDGLLKIADFCGWPKEAFEQAKQECISSSLEARFMFNPRLNPSRTIRGAFCWSIGMELASITAEFTDKQGKRIAEHTVAEQPLIKSAYFPYVYLGSMRWINNDTIRLLGKGRRGGWDVTVAGKVTEVACPDAAPTRSAEEGTTRAEGKR